MIGTVIPNKILSYDDIRSLKPKDRDEYYGGVVLDILKANPQGVTVPEICEKTGFYRDTVSKHLKRLVAIREAYEIVRGGTSFYHKNGKVVHESKIVQSQTNGNRSYTIYWLENDEGKFIYIQEKELDEFRAVTVTGGILVNESDLPQLISTLQKLSEEEKASELVGFDYK